ncbi:MAG: LapA family protein [Acidaminococcales bacterium]|nr:LapA family protein [Acidaminococcales bacterium]
MPFIIITMLICMVVAVFALQNAVVVPVKFIFFQQEASLVLVILASAFLGLLVGVSFTIYLIFKYFCEGR